MTKRKPATVPDETFERPSRATLDQFRRLADGVLDMPTEDLDKPATAMDPTVRELASVILRIVHSLLHAYDEAEMRRARRGR